MFSQRLTVAMCLLVTPPSLRRHVRITRNTQVPKRPWRGRLETDLDAPKRRVVDIMWTHGVGIGRAFELPVILLVRSGMSGSVRGKLSNATKCIDSRRFS